MIIKFTTGFAGSGKSSMLASNVTMDTLILTPTHKSAKVLKQKLGDGYDIRTIYSFLGLIPYIDENAIDGHITKIGKRLERELVGVEHIAIDEYSMIPNDVFTILVNAIEETGLCKRIDVYGDPYQLPPVTGNMIEALDWADETVELNVQHRSSAVETTAAFMSCMKAVRVGGAPVNVAGACGGDFVDKRGSNAWLNEFNPDTDKVLAWTNAEVMRLNGLIASNFGLNPLELAVGEKVLINNVEAEVVEWCDDVIGIFPSAIVRGELTEDEAALKRDYQKMMAEIEKYGGVDEYKRLCVRFEDGRVYSLWGDMDYYRRGGSLADRAKSANRAIVDKFGVPVEGVKDFARENRGLRECVERGRAWAAYINHDKKIFDVKRTYCITVHKSQGSEYNRVFCSWNDIKKSRNNRMWYVALSRAMKGGVLI